MINLGKWISVLLPCGLIACLFIGGYALLQVPNGEITKRKNEIQEKKDKIEFEKSQDPKWEYEYAYLNGIDGCQEIINRLRMQAIGNVLSFGLYIFGSILACFVGHSILSASRKYITFIK